MSIALAQDIAYVMYRHVNTDRTDLFLRDFGLLKVIEDEHSSFYRATSGASYCYAMEKAASGESAAFIGIGFFVESEAQLQEIQRQGLAENGIEDVPHWDGGKRVTVRDPNGLRVDLVWNASSPDELPHCDPLLINHSRDKPRRGATQRTIHGPSPIFRLGHVALLVDDVDATMQWYRETLDSCFPTRSTSRRRTIID